VRLKPDQPLAVVGGVALEGLIKAHAKPPPNQRDLNSQSRNWSVIRVTAHTLSTR
jgi:hypothetical protein